MEGRPSRVVVAVVVVVVVVIVLVSFPFSVVYRLDEGVWAIGLLPLLLLLLLPPLALPLENMPFWCGGGGGGKGSLLGGGGGGGRACLEELDDTVDVEERSDLNSDLGSGGRVDLRRSVGVPESVAADVAAAITAGMTTDAALLKADRAVEARERGRSGRSSSLDDLDSLGKVELRG